MRIISQSCTNETLNHESHKSHIDMFTRSPRVSKREIPVSAQSSPNRLTGTARLRARGGRLLAWVNRRNRVPRIPEERLARALANSQLRHDRFARRTRSAERSTFLRTDAVLPDCETRATLCLTPTPRPPSDRPLFRGSK